jgi:hypothetical protein
MALSKEAKNLYVDTRAWLVREHLYRIDQYAAGALRPTYASVRTKTIFDTSLPRAWREYQKLREIHNLKDSNPSHRLKLKLGQAALLSCAWAQSAYIWNSLAQRHNIQKAGADSFRVLDHYIDSIDVGSKKLPSPKLLGVKVALETVLAEENKDVEAYSRTTSVLCTVVGLALVGLQEQTPRGRDAIFPRPGCALGEVYPWVPPRLEPDS